MHTMEVKRDIKYSLTEDSIRKFLDGSLDCEVPGLRKINSSAVTKEFGIEFSKYTKHDVLVFHNAEVPVLKIEKLVTKHKIVLISCKCADVTFSQCKLPNIGIYNSLILNLSFRHSTDLQNLLVGSDSEITNVLFYEKTNVSGVYLNKSILRNAIIYSKGSNAKLIQIQDTHLGGLHIKSESSIGNVFIIANSVVGNISIGNNSASKDLYLADKSKAGNLKINNKSRCGIISVTEESQLGNIVINQSTAQTLMVHKSTVKDIFFSESILHGVFSVDESKVENLNIENRSITADISILNNSHTNSVNIVGSCSTGDISVRNSHIKGMIAINDNTVMKSFIMDKTDSRDIYIDNIVCGMITFVRCQSVSFVSIVKTKTGKLSILDSVIQAMEIDDFHNSITLIKWNISPFRILNSKIPALSMQGQAIGELLLNQCQINQIDMFGISNSIVITIANSSIYALPFNYTNILGAFYIKTIITLKKPFEWYHLLDELGNQPDENEADNIKEYFGSKSRILGELNSKYEEETRKLVETYPHSTLAFIQSSLGKTEISDSNLDDFDECIFYNTRISDCYIMGCVLPDTNKISYKQPGQVAHEEEKISQQKMYYYNQLRKLMESNGEIIDAGRYYTLLMREHERLLSSNANFSEWVPFLANRRSSNYGESWVRAFLAIILLALLFYILFHVANAAYGLNSGSPFEIENWKFVKTGLRNALLQKKQFFEFLNPAHRFDFMGADFKTNFWTYLIDFIGRIVIGYCIYQFVAAFRKYGRKIN